MDNDNSIFIGDKPLSNYVASIAMNMASSLNDTVIIKARGKFISRAVDVSQIAINKSLKDMVSLKEIRIGSVDFKTKEDKIIQISYIEIELKRLT